MSNAPLLAEPLMVLLAACLSAALLTAEAPADPRIRPREALQPTGRPAYPCVYETPDDVLRARRNAAETAWGKRVATGLVAAADRWFARDEAAWRAFLPPPGACYAYGFTGSPKNGATWGLWGGANCSWERPGQVTTTDGQVLPSAAYPDDGSGYRNPDGRVHYFVGSWNAWVTEQWTNAAVELADAYALTGEERYADRAAFFLDLLASTYPESSAGSWDYPSSPPSGRFARPWYQVARVLVRYVQAADLIWSSAALDRPSLRPAIVAAAPAAPRLQFQHVRTPDREGVTRPDLTRRQNIAVNLIEDGSYYCYEHSFGGALHNGHADYLRGALAGGALLGIPEYVTNAVTGPYSIHAMVANNCDRDGRYYETSLGYAIHARSLYLTFLGPLANWRDPAHPNGYDLVGDARFRSFYRLPALALDCAGHAPNFGDSSPDPHAVAPPRRPFNNTDYLMAEEIHAFAQGPAKEEFARILRWLAAGDVERLRDTNAGRWLLFHAEPVPPGPADLPADLARQVQGSWFLGQKGIGLLRDGAGADSQAVLLRFGPSLNHGHQDDLGLQYYAQGWQTTYDIGYGLGSTHTQVGWAKQTVSHCLVVVNERSQGGPGSGGSLRAFAALPGLRLVEADSPLSYGAHGVTEYRRLVAHLGEGRDQAVVDLFRVTGGHQHDYVIGGQGQEPVVDGLTLGAPEAGSLVAGIEPWGPRQGPDGDLVGHPAKPYWNPPPGTGYGFFWEPRRAPAAAPFGVTWPLGGDRDVRFTAQLLPESPAEAIVAKAPGLYPRFPKASYVLLRRTGEEGLRSVFATVLAAAARPGEPGVFAAPDLSERVAETNGRVVLGSGYGPGYLLFSGQAPGDHVTFGLEVEREGDYEVTLEVLHYKSYGSLLASLDGQRVGGPFNLRSAEPKALQRCELGRHHLAAGRHLLRLEVAPDSAGPLFGVQRVALRPAGQAPPVTTPVVTAAARLPVTGEGGVAVRLVRAGREEYLLSTTGDAECRATTPRGELVWSGGTAYLAYVAGRPVAAALVGCRRLQAPDCELTAATAAYAATVTAVDPAALTVDLDASWPATGLAGEAAIFSRPEWTRTSGYRVQRVESRPGGSRLHFGTQSFLLGQVRVAARPDARTVQSDVPLDYSRSVVSGARTGFFDGKRLVGPGGETRVRAVAFGQPLTIEVEDANRLNPGDLAYVYDLGPGDRVTAPTAVWVAAEEDGAWHGECSVAATVRVGGRTWDVAARDE